MFKKRDFGCQLSFIMAAQYTSDYAGRVILVLLNNKYSMFIVSGVDLAGCTF